MNLPHNISQDFFLATVNRITDRLAHKYVFAGYDQDDISQEAFIIAIDVLDKYDSSKPLENFLHVHISNRLKNFKRDNYYRQETGSAQQLQEKKKNILEPLDIHGLYNVETGDTILDQAHLNEILQKIDECLPIEFRGDYLRLKNNCKLTKSRKAKIIAEIKIILEGFL